MIRGPAPGGPRLFGSDVRGGEAAVDDERGRVDVARLVAREEERCVDDLPWLRHPPHRQMDEPALGGARRFPPDAEQQRRLDGPGAEGVDADSLPRELDAELLAEREDGSLRGRVRDLRRRGADE